ncbi:MAG: hypothetical protein IKH14_00200 [Prevotella sp.]|nr:hypothetical protein [Prevotella sp.]
MKNSFNISRFWQVLKWTFANNCQSVVKVLWIWTAIFVCYFLLTLFHYSSIHLVTSVGKGLFVGIFFILLIVFPSITLKSINKNRQHRLNTLMLPATNTEKFLSLIITVFCTYILTMIVAFLIADGVQFLVSTIFRLNDTGFVTAKLYQAYMSSMDRTNMGSQDMLFSTMLTIWVISVYLLGGMFFRRYAGLFVSLGFFLILMAIGYFGSRYEPDYMIEIDKDAFLYGTSLVLAILSLLNVWLSYRLFCRLQLINHKWINI